MCVKKMMQQCKEIWNMYAFFDILKKDIANKEKRETGPFSKHIFLNSTSSRCCPVMPFYTPWEYQKT